MPNFLLRAHFLNSTRPKVDGMPIYNAFLLLTVTAAIVFACVKNSFDSNEFLTWLIFLILITNSFLLIIQQKYQAERNGLRYFNQSIVWRIGFAIVLLILFFFKIHIQLNFLLISLLVIQVLLMIVAFVQECIHFKFKFEIEEQRDIFKFGFPLFLIGAMQYITFMNSRYFVYSQGDANETAIFSLIHTFVGALNLLFVVFVRVYIPKLFEVLNGSKKHESISMYKKLIFSLLEALTLFVFLSLFIYSEIYRSNFESEIFRLTPILVLGQFFYCFQIFIIDSLLYHGKTGKMFAISLMSALASVSIGYTLVQHFGIYGAALGVAITQFLSFLIVVYFTVDLFKLILGVRFCLQMLLRISMMMLAAYLCYMFLNKIFLFTYFVILGSYLIWKLDIPELYKKFA
jgi:O-antigen/teichoic acid export membrane protein